MATKRESFKEKRQGFPCLRVCERFVHSDSLPTPTAGLQSAQTQPQVQLLWARCYYSFHL